MSWRITPLLVLLPLVFGCGHDDPLQPTLAGDISASKAAAPAPESLPATGCFYPLEIGNRWTYEREFKATTVLYDDPTPIVDVVHSTRDAELTGIEHRNDVDYVVQESRIVEDVDPDATLLQWVRFRQDRSGLYEADVPVQTPPDLGASSAPLVTRGSRVHTIGARVADRINDREQARAVQRAWDHLAIKLDALNAAMGRLRAEAAGISGHRPGGPMENELTRLAYPLHPGQSWTIVEDFRSTVVRQEILDLPAGRFPAWRIAVESALFEPGDEAYVWFGRRGELALEQHVSGVATDDAGQEIGTLHVDDREVLAELDLQRPGRPMSVAQTP